MKYLHRSLPLLIALAAIVPAVSLVPRFAAAETKKHEAKYPMADARVKALAQVPGGTIAAEELEYEGKRWIYSFEIKPKGEKGKRIEEVNIDADSGEVLSVTSEDD